MAFNPNVFSKKLLSLHKTNRMKRNEIYLRLCLLFMALTSVLPMFSQGYHTNFMLSPAHFCDTIPLEFEDNQLYIPSQCRAIGYALTLTRAQVKA